MSVESDPCHGNSPAAWTAVIIMLIAVTIGTVAGTNGLTVSGSATVIADGSDGSDASGMPVAIVRPAHRSRRP